MRAALTDEQLELSRTAARLLADAARKDPLVPAWDALPVPLNRPLWASLAELGLLGLAVPEERGGAGAGVLEQCVLAEQVGAALPAVPFTGTAAVTALLARVPAGHAALAGVVDGSVVVAPAWETFPASLVPGSRGALPATPLSGTLTAVPFGLDADLLLVATDGGLALVEAAAPGVARTAVGSLDTVEPMAAVTLRDAPATALGPVAFPVAEILTVLAAELVGTGQRALDGAVGYAKERRQFGRAIGSFQAIKHMLADRFVQLDAARLLVHDAAATIDAGEPAEAAARTALVAASAAADAATADALQTHGGIGFTWEHSSHVLLKRARARRSLLGSPATQLDALAAVLAR
jgi:alkylation response protein AidB-like acyl-CoA dehydrogenase